VKTLRYLLLAAILWPPIVYSAEPKPAAKPRPVAVKALTLRANVPTQIDGPDNVEPYKFVRLGIPTVCDTVMWWLEPEDLADYQVSADTKQLVFVGPPGIYTARAVLLTIRDGRIVADQARKRVTIGVPLPPVPPEPPIPPVPPVPPKPTELYAVVVEESSLRTPEQAIVLGSQRCRAAFRGFRVTDQDVKNESGQPPTDLKPYLDRAKGKTLPYLMIVGADGTVWHEGTLPATVDAVLVLVKKEPRP